jgi:murein DD-endopeptidase MepM/ murein hydrolase activator NlpD
MDHRIARAVALALALLIAFPAVAAAGTWPVTNRSSYVSHWYSSTHRGIDIAAPKWTGVVPIGNGKVVFAGWKRNCGGYQVWVAHGNGLYSAYYHLAAETTYAGEYVTGSSEWIGKVGATGCASGNHLHLEVWRGYPWRWGSFRVNPWNYINKGDWLPYRYR